MIPVLYQYKREKNILDSLIEEFAKRNWLFDEMPTDYFHKYKWPDIVLSDRTVKLILPEHDENLENEFPYTIELLGCYQPSENPGEQGHVILFMPKLKQAALAYARHKAGPALGVLSDSDIKYFIELLTDLVLIHEFSHWIVHYGKSPNLFVENSYRQLQNIDYETADNVRFHETAAQILTNYICSKQHDLWDIFQWLSKQQPMQYNIYNELLWGVATSTNKVDENILANFISFLEESRHYDIQSYKYCNLHYKVLAVQQVGYEGHNGLHELDLYQLALNKLSVSDIFINELDTEHHMAVSNIKSKLGQLVSIYMLYMSSFYIKDDSKIFLMRLEEAFKNNFPWIFPILQEKFHANKTAR